MGTKSFIWELNELARLHPDLDKKQMLRNAAAELNRAIDTVAQMPTSEAMIALNGAWVVAELTWTHSRLPEPTDPIGGAPDAPVYQLAEAA